MNDVGRKFTGNDDFFKQAVRISNKNLFIHPRSHSSISVGERAGGCGRNFCQCFGAEHDVTAVESAIIFFILERRRKVKNIECPGETFQCIVKIGGLLSIIQYD